MPEHFEVRRMADYLIDHGLVGQRLVDHGFMNQGERILKPLCWIGNNCVASV